MCADIKSLKHISCTGCALLYMYSSIVCSRVWFFFVFVFFQSSRALPRSFFLACVQLQHKHTQFKHTHYISSIKPGWKEEKNKPFRYAWTSCRVWRGRKRDLTGVWGCKQSDQHYICTLFYWIPHLDTFLISWLFVWFHLLKNSHKVFSPQTSALLFQHKQTLFGDIANHFAKSAVCSQIFTDPPFFCYIFASLLYGWEFQMLGRQLVSAPLWSGLKYLNNYWMDCHILQLLRLSRLSLAIPIYSSSSICSWPFWILVLSTIICRTGVKFPQDECCNPLTFLLAAPSNQSLTHQ